MTKLKKMFSSPRDLLFSPSISSARKSDLLKKWQDERTLYIFENCRDYDYILDQEMEELLRSVKIVKAILSAQEESKVKISIWTGIRQED
jgi:hypothetical protein